MNEILLTFMTDERNKHIPPNARRVFKGVLYEIWQWDQQMYDGSVEVFECITRADSVDVVATVGDSLLLQMQQQPDREEEFLSLPGGRRNKGEEPLEAGKRELLEEMGYQSQDWMQWRKSPASRSRMKWMRYIYIARNCVKIAEPHLDAGEKIKEIRISFDEFLLVGDNPLFRNTDLATVLLKARYEPQEREALHTLLFGK